MSYFKKVDNISYRIDTELNHAIALSVDNYQLLTAHLHVPEMVDDIPVVRIRERAFDACFVLEEIYLPSSLEIIEACAFRNCINLKKVHFYKTDVQPWRLGLQLCAFAYCTALEEVLFDLPTELHFFHPLAFENCVSLRKMEGQLCWVDGESFLNCEKLDNLVFRNGTYWKVGAFNGCKSLKHITLLGDVARGMPKANMNKLKRMHIKCFKHSSLAELSYEGVQIEII